jgi:hypothetical protein
MRRITLVKKRLADGSPCRKCVEVQARLEAQGLAGSIDRVVYADECEPGGEGWRLAAEHGCRSAPFFVVEEDGAARVHTVYLQFVRELRAAPGRPAAGSAPAGD